MKFTITVDCSPVEARSFLGLPDVTPLHDIYLERVKTLVEQGVTPDLVSDIVKSWSSLGDAGMAFAQQMFGQIGSTLTGGSVGKGSGG